MGRELSIPQGRALGGSSAINAEVFITPSRIGIDAWEEVGNAGWNWDTLEPYFRKFHTLTIPPQNDCDHLGLEDHFGKSNDAAGPIQVSFSDLLQSPLPKAWNDTFKNLGYGFKGDLTAGIALGSFSNPITVHSNTRERSYAAVAYYQSIIGRPNLRVIVHAQVTKILFKSDSPDLIATGVDYFSDGQIKTLKAKKEIILAAGALQSPKLLELSGVGSKKLLQLHGISVLIENANVGENLQDHLTSGISFEVADHVDTLDDLKRRNPAVLKAALAEYATTKSGAFSRGPVTSTAFIPVVEFQSEEGGQELTNLLSIYPARSDEAAHHQFVRSILRNPHEGSGMPFMYYSHGNWGAKSAKELMAAVLADKYITISVALLHPFSSGHIHISSSDPTQPPTIDNCYLSHPLDLEILARHVLYLDAIAKTEPLASLLKRDGKRNPLYESVHTLDDVKDYVRKTAMSIWHPCGTCAMLPREKGGVVDANLKLYGTKNLRVVDASIMPMIPRANTVATVYAVAERAADLIKGEFTATKGVRTLDKV